MNQIKGATLVLAFGFSIHAMAATKTWTGDYSQKSEITFTGADNEKACKLEAPDTEWSKNECHERTVNKLTLSKVTDEQDKYFVQISILGGNIHSCDFAGEATLKDNKLAYEDVIPDQSDICKIEIEQNANGTVKVSAGDVCSEYYCGFGLELKGTDQAFARTGEGQEISHELAYKRTQE